MRRAWASSTITKDGHELVTDSGPIETVVAHIKARKQFGEDQNGAPARAPLRRPALRLLPSKRSRRCSPRAMRAGLLEVVSQAARITSHTDHRLEQVFANLPKFRAASFRPAEDTGPDVEVRGEVSRVAPRADR